MGGQSGAQQGQQPQPQGSIDLLAVLSQLARMRYPGQGFPAQHYQPQFNPALAQQHLQLLHQLETQQGLDGRGGLLPGVQIPQNDPYAAFYPRGVHYGGG